MIILKIKCRNEISQVKIHDQNGLEMNDYTSSKGLTIFQMYIEVQICHWVRRTEMIKQEKDIISSWTGGHFFFLW